MTRRRWRRGLLVLGGILLVAWAWRPSAPPVTWPSVWGTPDDVLAAAVGPTRSPAGHLAVARPAMAPRRCGLWARPAGPSGVTIPPLGAGPSAWDCRATWPSSCPPRRGTPSPACLAAAQAAAVAWGDRGDVSHAAGALQYALALAARRREHVAPSSRSDERLLARAAEWRTLREVPMGARLAAAWRGAPFPPFSTTDPGGPYAWERLAPIWRGAPLEAPAAAVLAWAVLAVRWHDVQPIPAAQCPARTAAWQQICAGRVATGRTSPAGHRRLQASVGREALDSLRQAWLEAPEVPWPRTMRVLTHATPWVDWALARSGAVGLAIPWPAMILLRTDRLGSALAGTLAHELGHHAQFAEIGPWRLGWWPAVRREADANRRAARYFCRLGEHPPGRFATGCPVP